MLNTLLIGRIIKNWKEQSKYEYITIPCLYERTRPLLADLDNFDSKKGTILSMPFKDNSIPSLSCLHVAEHIGLGRYGDPLDPLGTKKTTKELSRVLVPNGNLYFSVPIGKPRLCFNAHRIHSTQQIID